MWPKVFAQLVELLPHISRLVPMADKFFTQKTASEKANEAAMAALAKQVHDDLGQVTSAHEGLYRQLQQQGAQIAELAADASRSRLAAETAAEQSLALEKQIATLAGWVKSAVLLLVLLLGAVVMLLLRVR